MYTWQCNSLDAPCSCTLYRVPFLLGTVSSTNAAKKQIECYSSATWATDGRLQVAPASHSSSSKMASSYLSSSSVKRSVPNKERRSYEAALLFQSKQTGTGRKPRAIRNAHNMTALMLDYHKEKIVITYLNNVNIILTRRRPKTRKNGRQILNFLLSL